MSSLERNGTKIRQILQTVFPAGTQALDGVLLGDLAKDGTTSAWETIPVFPYDVFAFCAHFIKITGMMGYFEPNPEANELFGKTSAAHPRVEPLKIVLNREQRKKCKNASAEWRESGAPGKYPISLWKVIHDASDFVIRIKDYQRIHADSMLKNSDGAKQSAPVWWSAIFELLIIADEACDGIGHFYSAVKNTEKPTPFEDLASIRIRKRRGTEEFVTHGADKMVRARNQVSTLASAADRTVVCVQPKGRVAEVGCTLRNLSRNLSITGPVGAVQLATISGGTPREGRRKP